jgi:DNA-binding beta-propeller fold protein YncE
MNLQLLRASLAMLLATLAMPGGAVRAQSLLVVNGTNDPSQGSLLQYDQSTGQPIGGGTLVPAGAGGLNDPTALAIGPGGNLFVANGFDSSILEFNAQGAFQGAFVSGGSGGLSNPTSLAFGPDGNLYVASNGTSSVIEYSGATGAYIQTLGTIPGAGGLSNPEGLTYYGGNLYVVSQGSNAVLQYSFATGQYSTFVQSGAGGLSLPTGLAFGPDGNLYVASEGSSSILSYFGTTGFFDQTFVSSGFGGLSTPTALAFEADGTLLVASGSVAGANGAILDYDSGGNFLGTLVPYGSGGLVAPLGLAITAVPEPGSFTLSLIALAIAGTVRASTTRSRRAKCRDCL